MIGRLIYKGRRNIKVNIDGNMITVMPSDIIDIPLNDCPRFLANDKRFFPYGVTAGRLAKMRYSGNNVDGISGSLAGQKLFIIGRGPSAEKVNLDELPGHKLAVNGAFMNFKADSVIFVDSETHRRYGKELLEFEGNIYASVKTKYDMIDRRENVYMFPISRNVPQMRLSAGLYNGQLSGIAAINLGLILEADEIYLVGYDMDWNNPKTYMHNGDEFMSINKNYQDKNWVKQRIKQFRKFEDYKNIIFNVNTNTNIDIFDYKDLKEIK